jgi:hypothetical protein
MTTCLPESSLRIDRLVKCSECFQSQMFTPLGGGKYY